MTISLMAFLGAIILCGFITGDIRLPSDLTRSAQSAETLYAQVTAEMESIDVELTKIASQPVSTFIPSPSVNAQNWLDHFMHSPTCQIPCWENISPNVTNIDTATRIVSGIPDVRIVSLGSKSIGWYFDDKSSRGGYIVADQEGTVLQINLELDDSETLDLSDVIKSFGNPVAIKAGMDCNVILSYRYQGMLLSAYTSCSYNPIVEITPTTQIDRIILFSPDNQEYTLNIFSFHIDEIMWDGYKVYDFTNK